MAPPPASHHSNINPEAATAEEGGSGDGDGGLQAARFQRHWLAIPTLAEFLPYPERHPPCGPYGGGALALSRTDAHESPEPDRPHPQTHRLSRPRHPPRHTACEPANDAPRPRRRPPSAARRWLAQATQHASYEREIMATPSRRASRVHTRVASHWVPSDKSQSSTPASAAASAPDPDSPPPASALKTQGSTKHARGPSAQLGCDVRNPLHKVAGDAVIMIDGPALDLDGTSVPSARKARPSSLGPRGLQINERAQCPVCVIGAIGEPIALHRASISVWIVRTIAA
ncbi:hypothetical protein GY45DRAFT_1366374 [Cubamyces sp. BRFM 1775]|nr:hypothetical protein GY45DRAFT_1366374 [Cubamyces sp. BRFM 1775]